MALVRDSQSVFPSKPNRLRVVVPMCRRGRRSGSAGIGANDVFENSWHIDAGVVDLIADAVAGLQRQASVSLPYAAPGSPCCIIQATNFCSPGIAAMSVYE